MRPASGTRVQTRPTHTLVFVSTDGGAFGALGAARFADTSPYARDAIAVLSLDAIAGPGRPRLLIGGDTARSPAATLVRTATSRVLEETGRSPSVPTALRQLLDLGFPFTLDEQGPFVARGIPAVTLTTRARAPRTAVRGLAAAPPAAGRARTGRAEPRRVARCRPRGRARVIELRLRRHALRPRMGDRARAAHRAAALRDRRGRPVRALPPPADSARAGGAQPAQPPVLLGLCGPAAVRRRESRRVRRGRAASAAAGRCGARPAARRSRSGCSDRCCSPAGWSAANA